MKKIFKRCIVSVLILVGIISSTAFAAGSYRTTYSMTGGVFSSSITAKNYIETNVSPETGTDGVDMAVILATKHWYGWDGPVKYISSTRGGTVTHSCTGTYNIWLRNFSGMRWTGDVSFHWE